MPGLPRSEMVFLRATYPRLRPRDRRSSLLHWIEVRVPSIRYLPKSCCTGQPWWLDPATGSIVLGFSRLDWLAGNAALRRPTSRLLKRLPGAGDPPVGAVHQLLRASSESSGLRPRMAPWTRRASCPPQVRQTSTCVGPVHPPTSYLRNLCSDAAGNAIAVLPDGGRDAPGTHPFSAELQRRVAPCFSTACPHGGIALLRLS
jgi:hypothetical protein